MKLTKKEQLKRRHWRVRAKVHGTTERPRLCIRKSLKHFYAVLIDDSFESGSKTLACFTTASKENPGRHMANIPGAAALGAKVGAELKNRGINAIVFDRGGYRYHGCVKALADAMREAGVSL
jgi:large subunit ribosomal protein L18